jgi:tRNA dimethylallyltransferase
MILDPAAAAVNEASNMRRTVRSLEVILSSGRRLLDLRGKKETPYRLCMVGLRRPRPELYARVDARIEQMLASGFLEEVQGLLAKGYSSELPTLSAIGYREMIAYLRGRLTMDEAVVLMKRLTRRYIRQQSNWFRDEDAQIHWFDCAEDTPEQVIELLRARGY